jgi:hypothetical protein
MDFLEALVTRFTLTRTSTGVALKLDLSPNTRAIWQRGAKSYLERRIPRFKSKAKEKQDLLDAILLDGERGDVFDDLLFPFRYVSGGTLPIIRFLDGPEKEKDYYAFIYREVFPVGWNIANGGADSLSEILNPFRAVERELREELVIFGGDLRTLYVFEYESGRPELRPEYAAARVLWKAIPRLARRCRLGRLGEQLIPVRWLSGPDSLHLRFGGKSQTPLDGFFLNINAKDFGIEVDRIASLGLPSDVILYDGELMGHARVAAPVGLFEVSKVQEAVAKRASQFVPDLFYYECKRYRNPKQFPDVVNGFINRMARDRRPKWNRREWDSFEPKFGLCPVTERIVRRHAKAIEITAPPARQTPPVGLREFSRAVATLEPEQESQAYDVFVSFAHEDQVLAQQVARYLRRETGRTIFLSCDQWHTNYPRVIDEALESATCFVAVASDPTYLQRNWVQYEYRAFHVLATSGRKSSRAQMLSYIDGFDPHALPLPLLTHEAIQHDRSGPVRSFRRVLPFVLRSPHR